MKRLRAALIEYLETPATGASADADALTRRLRVVSRANEAYLVVSTLVLVAGLVSFIVLHVWDLPHHALVNLATSVFVAALVRGMRLASRESVTTQTLLALTTLDDDALRRVARRILEHVQK